MQINRFLFPIAAAVALAFPSAASATFWTGPFVPQVNNDGGELAVQVHKGQPQKVTQFEFHNVPTGTPCNGSNIFFHHMELNDNNRFNGSGHPGQLGQQGVRAQVDQGAEATDQGEADELAQQSWRRRRNRRRVGLRIGRHHCITSLPVSWSPARALVP